LKDPAKRAQIQQALAGAPLSPNVGGTLSKLGTSMQSATTPGAALATGAGGLLGAGLSLALKRRQRAKNANTVGDSPNVETDLNDPTLGMSDDLDIPGNVAGINQFRRGGATRKAFGGVAEEEPLPEKKPKGVLLRRPMPVLHTTIVIATKKKPPEKKKSGGTIKAKKPNAIPPRRGPTPMGPPAPFAKGGHVQVPKGSGCASKGKRFRGIF